MIVEATFQNIKREQKKRLELKKELNNMQNEALESKKILKLFRVKLQTTHYKNCNQNEVLRRL